MKVSQLYIYPIKSLAGIALSTVQLTEWGFQYDRKWMLVDDNNRFISQREIAEMSLMKVSIADEELKVYHSGSPDDIFKMPVNASLNENISVQIWDDSCVGILVSRDADEWFSKKLNTSCRLVRMNNNYQRLLNPQYNVNNSSTAFADGFPVLLISEASLQDLNQKTTEPIPMNRFRPNLVISNSKAFAEDTMKEFMINGIHFYGVKPCARCVITTINQDNAIQGKEPLKTLASYRNKENKIYFGENVITESTGEISIGDTVTILETKESLFSNHQ